MANGRRSVGEGLFGALGRGIVRHPWYPIVFWIVLLALVLPFLGRVNLVTTNSATTLPDSAPSSIAAHLVGTLFPNASAGSESLLVFTGANVTNASSQTLLLEVAQAIEVNRSLSFVSQVDTLYSSYGGYLTGLASVGLGAIVTAEGGSPPLSAAMNGTAALVWSPPATFLRQWESLTQAHPSTPPAQWNWPAYQATEGQIGSNVSLRAILSAFYYGPSPSSGGFNGSLNCASAPAAVVACADQAGRVGAISLMPTIAPGASAGAVFRAAAELLGTENFTQTAPQRFAASAALGEETGLPGGWLATLWSAFPNGSATAATIGAFVSAYVASGTIATYSVPVPTAIRSQFVDPSGTAAIVLVAYSVGSGYTDASGHHPIFDDVAALDRLVPSVLAASDPGHSLRYLQTGGAALDQTENADLNSSLALVLPLTLVVLVLITMLYFRAPLAPAVTFGGLGIALALSLGGVVLLGTLIQKVDTTALTLENTFVLGVGTDYSIFLVARYREELHRGKSSHDAVVTSVTWAGQSVATSGATAVLATLALAFSGVALLSQWGMVLSLAVLITVLVSLTLVPAFLVLLGPKVLWPTVGAKLARQADEIRERNAAERTYFFRAGRRTQRRPRLVVAVIVLASIPLIVLALNVPLSFDFYAQLPAGHAATDGLAELGTHFGPGFAFPVTVLVRFHGPLLSGIAPNATEFTELSDITGFIASTPGVASVRSPVGAGGAPLGSWLAFASLPVATQAELRGVLASALGTDGRTVALSYTTTTGGLSSAAVGTLDTVRGNLTGYAAAHPGIDDVAFGGGASITHDLQAQTALATERMAIAVSIGLILVLLAVLRSWLIPLMAVATIGLSIGWAWGITDLVMHELLGYPLFFFAPTVMFILILGLGIDYNIFLLTRVREERLNGRPTSEATVHAVASTGGIITAAAVILASAFAILLTGNFILLKAIGFAVATAILLDAMIVRTYLAPGLIHLAGDRVWTLRPGGRDASGPSAPPP